MPAFSFIHAADLHLDSPFLGLSRLPTQQRGVVDELRWATFHAFENIIERCIDEPVDFLLIAGDVYDGADRSLQAQLRFRDGLRKLSDAGIHSFIVHGNHDPLDGWADSLQAPALSHVFGPEIDSIVFEKDGVAVARIHGVSYPTRKIGETFGKGFCRTGSEPFQIGLFHCNVGGNTQHDAYAPRTEADLIESSLDYWALGHIHESIVLREADPFIGYSGNTQGRHVNESGQRGCFLVRVSDAGQLEASPEFFCTDTVRWSTTTVDIAGLDTLDQLLGRIDEHLDRQLADADGRPVITRVILAGRGPLHHSLNRPNAMNTLWDELAASGTDRDPFICIEKLVTRTRPDIDLAARRDARDFLGDLLRLIDDFRQTPDGMERLTESLSDLYDHRRARKLLEQLDDSMIRELLNEAETRCAELLLQEDA